MRSFSFHLGRLHLPVYGMCAALGLMGFLVLSQVTARRARLDPDKVWDAVVAIAVAALLVSRVLLVAGSFQFFMAHPVLVLTLPTVNDTGLLLTSVFSVSYLRWKRLPLFAFLDAMAPCAALLWGFLSFGRLAEGTREGMLTASERVRPVELYTMLAAAILCVALLQTMQVNRPDGRVCAQGLTVGGASVFLLAFVRIPADLEGAGILDPVQWMGLAMVVVGCSLWIALPATEKMRHTDAV